jgi:inner membrane protein
MMELITHLEWYHWWILAAALAAAESFVPGGVAIWFAASASVVGALLLVAGVPWQLQLVLFGVLGLVAVLAFRQWKRRNPDRYEQPNLNQRAAQYIGQEFVLIEAIAQGVGKIQLGDGVWKVSGPDLPVGARVRVKGVNGTLLLVESS